MHGGVEGAVSGVEGSEVDSVEVEVEEIVGEPDHAMEVCHGMVGRQFLGQMQAAVRTPRGHSLFSHCLALRPLYIPSHRGWKQSIT